MGLDTGADECSSLVRFYSTDPYRPFLAPAIHNDVINNIEPAQ